MRLLPWSLALAASGFAFVGVGQMPDAPKPEPAPLKVAPRAYFRDHCQRCHGIDGSNLIPGFAEKEPLEKLVEDVRRMAEGPGDAPLTPKDLDVQVAYMQLASATKPFLAWTGRDGMALKGEASDGSKVTATVGNTEVKVTLDEDFGWTLTLPSEAAFKSLKLTATLGKEKTELVPAERSYAVLPKKVEEK